MLIKFKRLTPRWNPTKEQINMLEGFYRQGMRTPSADQIQEITSRLRAYGHIEGKNVFYWFQNHKARQRQRQRQNLNNVAGSPFYIPQASVGYYPHYNYNSKVLLPSITTSTINKRRSSAGMDYKLENMDDVSSSAATLILHDKAQHQMMSMDNNNNNNNIHQTLPLFPQHPTGILDDKLDNSFVSSSSSTKGSDHHPSKSSEFGVDPGNQPFIDFFANH